MLQLMCESIASYSVTKLGGPEQCRVNQLVKGVTRQHRVRTQFLLVEHPKPVSLSHGITCSACYRIRCYPLADSYDIKQDTAEGGISGESGWMRNRASKSRAQKRGWGQLGAGNPYSPC